jgi:glycosyltransferase involved in cell wall biosynthesis
MPASSPQCWENVPIPDSFAGRTYGRVSQSELRTFEEAIRNADIVFIHLLYRDHSTWAARIARESGKPIVVVPHGGLDPYVFTYRGLRKRIWLRMHRDLLFGGASTMLFATDAEAKKAGSAVRWSSEGIIPWPVERLTSAPDGAVRHKGTSTCRKLLFVGRIHPMKRVLETIRALRSLNRPDWHLTIAGPATSEIPVETLTREAGGLWGDQIRYMGEMQRGDLGALYAESDALLLFSHRENFGYVVAEAMCEGLPVVISDDVDLSSVVARSGSGMVKTIGTQNHIVEALTDLLALTSEELTAMGISGARTAEAEFTFERFAASLNALAEDCVSRHRLREMSANGSHK